MLTVEFSDFAVRQLPAPGLGVFSSPYTGGYFPATETDVDSYSVFYRSERVEPSRERARRNGTRRRSLTVRLLTAGRPSGIWILNIQCKTIRAADDNKRQTADHKRFMRRRRHSVRNNRVKLTRRVHHFQPVRFHSGLFVFSKT